MSTLARSVGSPSPSTRSRLADDAELAKPEVSSLVLASTLVGFYLGARGTLDWVLLAHALVGTGLVAGGTGAFNQLLEREDDARMRRTAGRHLPAGRLEPGAAPRFAALLSAGGVLSLALLVPGLARLLAFATWASYLFLYTPLKKRTT